MSGLYENLIKEKADIAASEVKAKMEELRRHYFEISAMITNHSYESYDWRVQNADIARLGKLAIAIDALGEAYGAINTARCN